MRIIHLWFTLLFIVCVSILSCVYVTVIWIKLEEGDSALTKPWVRPGTENRVQNSFHVADLDISAEKGAYYNGSGIMLQQSGLMDTMRRTPRSNSLDKIPAAQPYNGPSVKLIMDYNPNPIPIKFFFQSCEYSCALTSDPAKADLLMFNGARMGNVTSLPKRPQDQIWLLYTREPPQDRRFRNILRLDLANQINWTRTIFKDSTFPDDYGELGERLEVPERDYEAIYKGKKYDAAWFVSHCETLSRREEYIKRMSALLTVHTFGSCGNRQCGSTGFAMGGKRDECLAMLSKDYKFYLSFENAFCRDYVTEKFINMYEDVDIIPVVRGGADYHRLYPTGSFVNAGNFRSPEDLAIHLRELFHDKNRYLAMLREKNRYMKAKTRSNWSCDICKALHLRQPVNTYTDIFQWLRRPGNCWDPNDL